MKNFKVIESNTNNNERNSKFYKNTILRSVVTKERYRLCYDVQNGVTRGTIFVYGSNGWNYLISNLELGLLNFPCYVSNEDKHIDMQSRWEKKCIEFLNKFEK